MKMKKKGERKERRERQEKNTKRKLILNKIESLFMDHHIHI